MITIVESQQLGPGDRIVVESPGGVEIEATVVACLGWGSVHGVMDWRMRWDDGRKFTYGMPVGCPVRKVD